MRVRPLKFLRDGVVAVLDAADSPDFQHLFTETRRRGGERLTRREVIAEMAVGGGFLASSVALLFLAGGHRHASVETYVLLIGCFAVVSRVEFDVGSVYTVPSQVVLIPMLLLLPPATVPLSVALAFVVAKLPYCARGERSWARLPLSVGDAWFALGPAAVLAAAGSPTPSALGVAVAVAACMAQFAVDFAAWATRAALAGEPVGRNAAEETVWVYMVDILLWPIGLMAALAAEHHLWAIGSLLFLAALISLFSFERRARLKRAVELSAAYRGTAVLLGDVVEADHEYTGTHSKGVVELAVAVAEQLGLDADVRQRVEFGALLHDIGKIAIPTEIIDKPGPLDDDEWAVMRRHTIEGERMLNTVGGLLADIGRVVRSSHERFDGGGYPDGLAAEAIPIESRIVACCDAYSAMTTDRAYREARNQAEAIAELKRCAFTQFDPEVVIALIRVLERGQSDGVERELEPIPSLMAIDAAQVE